ncbi:DUF2971 domain-containing protein [Providencia vermicola]|uniref:DUF2971 domain-containing protein n=1 Tax=Providencia TaxID=586 RepID=UPI002349908F|nr:DUF2971 domain-containing protein [Providencia sp. PROV130]
MILYKYLSVSRVLEILNDERIAFTTMDLFNDPFEFSSMKISQDKNLIDVNIVEHVKRIAINNNYPILCLTRQPLNPLMWSHYADSHKGIVIGINILKTNFTSEDDNIIPAQYGNIIYTQTKPLYDYVSKENFERTVIGETCCYQSNNLEKLQRRYLYKSSHWSYEEEVRIVKCAKSNSLKVSDENNKVYFYSLNLDMIDSIFIGIRTPKKDINEILIKLDEKIKIYECKINKGTWDMKAKKVEIENVFKDKTKSLKFKPI